MDTTAKRIIIVGDESSAKRAGIDQGSGCVVELARSLEEAVRLRESYGSARIIIDPSFDASPDFEVLREPVPPQENVDQLLQDFIDSTSVAIAIFDTTPPYRVIAHNKAYQQLWPEPYQTHGLVGKYISDYSPGAEERGVFKAFKEVAQTRQPLTINDYAYEGMDRGRTWWNWSLSPIIRKGKLRAFANTMFEVTDEVLARKQVEALAEESERDRDLFQSLIDTAPAAIFAKGLDGRLMVVNERFADLLGCTREQVMGKTIYDFYPPEVALDHAVNDQAVTESGQPWESEEIIPQGGGDRIFLSLKFPLRDSSGRIYGIGGIYSDITVRKHAEEEAAKAREEAEERAAQLQSWFASMADGVALLDAQGHVITMNEAGRKLLGVGENQLVGSLREKTKWFSLDNKLVGPDETSTFRALLQGETIRDARYRIITTYGSEVIVSVSAAPVRDAHGRIIGAVNVFRDISERVMLEQQREELLERERHIADVLQEALVPKDVPTEIGNYRIAVTYRSALREAEIGGDFYDIIELDGGKIGILIGDVVGKGLPAAIRVAAARYAIRSYVYLDPRPGRAMELANEALCRDKMDESGMLTAFLAVVDTNVGSVTYANAGHEPPVLITSSGAVEELSSHGIPLSVLDRFTYQEASRRFNPGDRIVMVTDGITEARNEKIELFEKEGVIDYVKAHAAASAQEVADGLLEAAKAHAGGQLQDDVAIVVFEQSA